MRVQPSLSTEYVECSVRATNRATDLPISVSGDPVSMAFTASGVKPAPTDWKAATWLSTTAGSERAGVLVGPGTGGLVLAPGSYDWWVRVTDNPEVPAAYLGELRIN
jgi:hypothetical protein